MGKDYFRSKKKNDYPQLSERTKSRLFETHLWVCFQAPHCENQRFSCMELLRLSIFEASSEQCG